MSRLPQLLALALGSVTLATTLGALAVIWQPAPILELARPTILNTINSVLAGEVTVESISGQRGSGVQLHNVSLSDPRGELVFYAPRIRVQWSPFALVDRQVQIDKLSVINASVHWKQTPHGKIGFLEAFKTASPKSTKPIDSAMTLPVAFILNEFVTHDLDVTVNVAERRPLERRINIEGKGAIHRDLVVETELHVRTPEDRIVVTAEGFSVDDYAGEVEAQLDMSATLASWLSDSDVHCDLAAHMTLGGSSAQPNNEAWRVKLDAEFGQSSVAATSRWSSSFDHTITQLDAHLHHLNACLPSAPAGTVTLGLHAERPLEKVRLRARATADTLRFNERNIGGGQIAVSLWRRPDGFDVGIEELRWKLNNLRLTAKAPDIHINAERIVVDELRVAGGGARLAAKLDLNRSQPWARGSTAEIKATIPELHRFQDLVGRRLRGSAHAALKLVGNNVPYAHGDYRVDTLQIDDSPAITIQGGVRTKGRVVMLDGQLERPKKSPLPAIQFEASVTEATSKIRVKVHGLSGEKSEIAIRGDAGWRNFHRDHAATHAWRGHLSSHGVQAELMRPFIPQLPALAGKVDLFATAAWSGGRPTASVKVQFIDLVVSSRLPAASGSLYAELDEDTGALKLDVDRPISASLSAKLPATSIDNPSLETALEQGALRLEIDSADLGEFSELAALRPWRGRLGLNLDYRDGAARADLRVRKLRHRSFAPVADGKITARSDREAVRVEAEFDERFGGALKTQAYFPASIDELVTQPEILNSRRGDVKFVLDQLGVDRLITDSAFREIAAGSFHAEAHVEGNLDDWSGELSTRLVGGVFGQTAVRHFAIEASLDDTRASGRLEIETADKGEMILHGETSLRGQETLVVKLQATDFALEPLRHIANALGSTIMIDGRLNSDIELTFDDGIRLQGKATLSEGLAEVGSIIPPVNQIQAQLSFGEKESSIELSGKSSGGRIELSAHGYGSTIQRVVGQLKVKDVPLSAERAVLQANLNVDLEANVHNEGLESELAFHDSSLRVISLSDQALHSSEELRNVRYVENPSGDEDTEAQSPRTADSTPELSPWTIAFVTQDPITIEGEQVSASVESNVTVSNSDKGVQIGGKVSIPGGTIELGPHRYTIERANVIFREQNPVDPRLNASFVKEFEEPTTSFYVRVGGSARTPSIAFASNPDIYDQSELVGFFLGGQPGSTGDGLSGAAAAAALASVLTAPVQREIAKALPIDTFTIAPDEQERDEDALALTTGKWITPDLFVAYVLSVNTSAPEEGASNSALLRYRITPRWTLEMRVEPGAETSGSADLFWIKRF